MDSKIIGVDFSGNALTMVLVTFGRDGYRIEACEQVSLAGGDGWTGAAEAIARIREKSDTREATCIASFPDEWVFHRMVSMPFVDRKKISKVIAYEIEPLLPFPLDDAVIDFQPAAASQLTDSGNDFFAAVASKSRLKSLIEKMNALGLDPEIITCRGYAVASVLSSYKHTGLFVDGDEQRLLIGGFTGGKVRFVQTLIAGRQNRSRSQAVVESLNHVLIADEERQRTDFKPDTVFLTDDSYRLSGMKEYVEATLGITVSGMNISGAAGLDAGGCPEAAGGESGGLDVALCLTLLKRIRRPFINFRKDEFAVTGKWRQYSDVFFRTGLMAALVIIIGVSGYYYDLKNCRSRIAAIDARMRALFKDSFPQTPLVDDPLLQMRVELDRLKGKSGLPAEMERKAYCIDILNDISRLISPENDVVIEKLVVSPEDVQLSGSTGSFNSVDALKSEFGKSAYFGKIEISSATMSKVDKRVNFKLRLELL